MNIIKSLIDIVGLWSNRDVRFVDQGSGWAENGQCTVIVRMTIIWVVLFFGTRGETRNLDVSWSSIREHRRVRRRYSAAFVFATTVLKEIFLTLSVGISTITELWSVSTVPVAYKDISNEGMRGNIKKLYDAHPLVCTRSPLSELCVFRGGLVFNAFVGLLIKLYFDWWSPGWWRFAHWERVVYEQWILYNHILYGVKKYFCRVLASHQHSVVYGG